MRIRRALILAFALAALLVCARAVFADDGPYNTNPPYCRGASMLSVFWWYYDCMYPDDPTWGQVPG